jgi:hypothetical protein
MQSAANRGYAAVTTKNRITVNLEDDEYEALLKLSADTDRSLAWLGRRAICELLAKRDDSAEHVFTSIGDRGEASRPQSL